MDISVIIVSYNVKEFLRGAIASVRRSFDVGNLTGEILVVDNDSSDGSAEMVAAEFPDVRLFALNENLGFGRANNLALREAKGDYLLLLNPDTIVAEDTLRTMVDFMRDHPDAGLAGCKLLNGDGTFQRPCRRGFPTPWASFTKLFGLAALFPNSKLFARYHLTYLSIDATYEVDALSGAFMMLSRKAWESTRGFDEAFFMYGEDLDLCYRIKEAGLKVYYVHSTATVHFQGESTRRSTINEVAVFYDAMHVFVKKHYRASIIFSLLLRLGIFLRGKLAVVRKYRSSFALAALDYLMLVFSVLIGSFILLGSWMGLPEKDYPSALIFPPLVSCILLYLLKAYHSSSRWSVRPVLIAIPAMLVGLSSLTYFFKEFTASRQFVVVVTVIAGFLLLADRLFLRILRRSFGIGSSASPFLRPTLIVGTDKEAVRIATLLKRMEFLRRYQVVGFIDNTLERVGLHLSPGIPILGDVRTIAKVARDRKISEIIFANSSLAYIDVLGIMQRTSESLPIRVNFSMVPVASDILIGREKIELLTDDSGDSLALVSVENNLGRLSHRFSKRVFDLAVSSAMLPFVALAAAIMPSNERVTQLRLWGSVFRGERTLVGVEDAREREVYYAKEGFTSLAAVTAGSEWRDEDIRQFDRYYARNHSLGMDCEILLKAVFVRRNAKRGH